MNYLSVSSRMLLPSDDDDAAIVLNPKKRTRSVLIDKNNKIYKNEGDDDDDEVCFAPRRCSRSTTMVEVDELKKSSAQATSTMPRIRLTVTPKKFRTSPCPNRKPLPPQAPALGGLAPPPHSNSGVVVASVPKCAVEPVPNPAQPVPANSFAPPPPPPPPGPIGSTVTSKIGPLLKPLVWNKVPKNRLKGTVWQEVKDADELVRVDIKTFQELFLARPVSKCATGKGSEAKLTVTALIDPKRANNLSIILSRIKVPFDKVCAGPPPAHFS